jgi:hypothetical protein
MSEPSQSQSLEQVLAEQEIAWQRLLAALARVPADRAEEPGVCGDWPLKTLVGHIGYWDRFEADRFANRPDLTNVDWERLNLQNAAESARRGYDDLSRELLASHEQFRQAVARSAAIDPVRLRELSTEHYVEHAAEIEAWLDGAG